ncbi:MAG: glycosyltransferase family 2 protein, partial [Desulfovibrionaceae bacterium]|nr:glycosyltransferase family 2 protein [Desulfovibrionaceae bacterium]
PDIMRLNPDEAEKKLDYINGASLLIRREVFEKIGLLPEEYFLYYEDADLCTAARRAGFRLGWAKESLVLHMEGASHSEGRVSAGPPPAKPRPVEYYTIRNRLWFIKKFYPNNLPAALAGALLSLGLRICRRHGQNLGTVIRATRDALRGQMRSFHAE